MRVLGGRGVKQVRAETTVTKEEFRTHFKRVSEERFENLPEDLEKVVDRAVDLREDEPTLAALKAKGQAPITQEQGQQLAKELRCGKPPCASKFQ